MQQSAQAIFSAVNENGSEIECERLILLTVGRLAAGVSCPRSVAKSIASSLIMLDPLNDIAIVAKSELVPMTLLEGLRIG